MMRELILLLALSAGASWAGPSFFGPTGVLNTPTAAVAPSATYNVFLNFANIEDADVTRYGANAGLGVATPFEIGFTTWDIEDGDSHLVLNAKVVLPVQMKTPGALAIGVIDVTDEEEFQTPYLVYSREFTMGVGAQARPVYGSIGFGSSDSGWGVLDGLFLSAAMPVAEKAWAMLEFDAEDLNFGARVQLSDALSADIAIVSGDAAVGLAYRFPTK